jgi:hypothetical protein
MENREWRMVRRAVKPRNAAYCRIMPGKYFFRVGRTARWDSGPYLGRKFLKTSNNHPPSRFALWRTRHPTPNIQGADGRRGRATVIDRCYRDETRWIGAKEVTGARRAGAVGGVPA